MRVCTHMCTCVCTYVVYYIFLFQIYKQVSALHVPTWISSLLFFTLLLEYNCFRRLCSLLLYKEVNQLFVHIHPPPSWASLPLISHPSRSTQHWVELPGLCSSLEKYLGPPGTCSTHGSVYMSVPTSQFSPPSPSPTRPFVHSLSASLFLPWK